MPPYRVGIDAGGTITDLVLLDEVTGGVRHTKVLGAAPNPAEGVPHAPGRAAVAKGAAGTPAAAGPAAGGPEDASRI
jgi:N-methylhydantoinase A/oxoprolinase/acetone carboxylase beta subunit